MRFCVPLGPDARAAPPPDAAEIGGKARSLLRLAAAGLAVPPAFAVAAALFRALRSAGPALPGQLDSDDDLAALDRARAALLTTPFPADFSEQLRVAVHRLGAAPAARYSVRSSFASEDRLGALAAGLFQSVTDVAAEDVAAAVKTVLASALAPAAWLYARRRQLDIDAAGMAVLVHPFITGQAMGSAAWAPSVGAAPATIDGLEGDGETTGVWRAAIEAALRTLVVAHGPSEVEWVAGKDGVVFLQLRPFVPATPGPIWPGWSALGDGDWRWDASHNPLPLSAAQAGLIQLVDERCATGLRQRVVGGYLFYQAAPATKTARPVESASTPATGMIAIADRLAATRVQVADALAALGPSPGLEPALETFVSLYQAIMGDLQPAARQARQALRDFLASHATGSDETILTLLADVPSIATRRRALHTRIRQAGSQAARADALAVYLGEFGDETAVWDVAAPTFAEDSTLVSAGARADGAAAAGERRLAKATGGQPNQDSTRGATATATASALRARIPAAARASFDRLLAEAREAVVAGEEDDHLYARAQAAVRRALLGEGRRLRDAGILASADDVFWLPLAAVRAHATGAVPLAPGPTAAATVAHARGDAEAARLRPPLGPAQRLTATDDHALMRGRAGAGGRVVGRAFVYPDPRGVHPTADSILVARTLLPTELPLLFAAGLVIETGGVVGHVAAQARERGIPAVVGAAGVLARVHTGDRLLVDGDGGTVLILSAT